MVRPTIYDSTKYELRHYAQCAFVSTQNHTDIAILKLTATPDLAESIPYVGYFLEFNRATQKASPRSGEEVLAIGHGMLTPNESNSKLCTLLIL
jgi:hypothetical protein